MPTTTDEINSLGWVPYALVTANTARDGTGTPNWVFRKHKRTMFFRRIRVQPLGGNVATVARCFINNGQDHANPANNILFDEVTCPGTGMTQEAAQVPYVPFTLNLWLPAGYRINILIGITVAAGFAVSGTAGQYSGELSDPNLYKTEG